MIKLQNYIDMINERGAGWEATPDNKDVTYNGKKIKAIKTKDLDLDKVDVDGKTKVRKGASAEDNGTQGLWAIDPPADDELDGTAYLTMDETSDNFDTILTDIRSRDDFFVQGEAGWGKTDQIMTAAHKCGLTVLTVYLDKAEATDLGGIPIPTKIKTKNGELTYTAFSLPGWAVYMAQHPETQFLLFFDEMNQAQPDVMNALMPIVLKHVIGGVQYDNFLVGAAGNFENENFAVNELSKPLSARFDTIVWESRTEEAWDAAFKWAHKNYDDKIGAEVIDKLKQVQDEYPMDDDKQIFWNAPRDLVLRLYNYIDYMLSNPQDEKRTWGKERVGLKTLVRKVDKCVYKEGKRQVPEQKIKELAEWILNYAKNGGTSDDGTSSRSKKKMTNEGITSEMKQDIMNALRRGKIVIDNKVYIITPDNIINMFDGLNELTPEMLKRIIRQMEDEGDSPMFKNQEEGEKYAKEYDCEIVK